MNVDGNAAYNPPGRPTTERVHTSAALHFEKCWGHSLWGGNISREASTWVMASDRACPTSSNDESAVAWAETVGGIGGPSDITIAGPAGVSSV
jgi:hypothetical protein